MATPFTIECFTELGLGICVITLRMFARCRSEGIRNLQWDDYLMMFSAIPYAGLLIAAYRVAGVFDGFANINMTDEYRAALSPSSHEYQLRTRGSQNHLIGWYVYVTLLWCLKGSMVVFYMRLTGGVTDLRIHVRVAFVSLLITYIIVIMTISLGCDHFHHNWQINPNPGNRCQVPISRLNLYMVLVMNIATDVLLLLIPVLMIYIVRLPMRKKLMLGLMFSGSIFVMAAGILRVALIVAGGASGAQQSGNWAIREAFVAVVINNVPMIYSFIRHWVLRDRNQSYGDSGYAMQSGHKGSKGTKLHSFTTQHPLSDSAEHIVGGSTSSKIDSASSKAGPADGIYVTTETIVKDAGDMADEDLKYLPSNMKLTHDPSRYQANVTAEDYAGHTH